MFVAVRWGGGCAVCVCGGGGVGGVEEGRKRIVIALPSTQLLLKQFIHTTVFPTHTLTYTPTQVHHGKLHMHPN